MAQVTIIRGDAGSYGRPCGMLLTDPPYEMPGKELHSILSTYETDHLVLLTTLKQLLEFLSVSDWELRFDFVWDGCMPKKSMNFRQPNYTHQTGVYLTKPGARSVFSRKLRARSDALEGNGYWPTIFQAPRTHTRDHGHAKNPDSITDLLGSFEVEDVCDPFAGSGSVAVAAWELQLKCVLIEKDPKHFESLKEMARFMHVYGLEVVE